MTEKLRHCCGLQGFNPMLGDTCPECDSWSHDNEKEQLKKALRRMCEYANYLGNEVLVKLGNANYAGDFIKQYQYLLD